MGPAGDPPSLVTTQQPVRCNHSLFPFPHKPGFMQSLPSTTGGCLPPKCSCADPLPKMDYILDSSPLTKVDGGVMILHEAEEDAVNWMNSVATITLAKTIRCNLHVAAAQNDVTLVLSRAAHTIGKARWPQ